MDGCPRQNPAYRLTKEEAPRGASSISRATARRPGYIEPMCRNIRTLHNFEPPATREEVHASSLQYVRKISGSSKPSQANEAAFDHAVAEIQRVTQELLDSLVTTAPPRNREAEAAKARARAAQRFATAA